MGINNDMIPVFVPRKMGMTAIYALARDQNCRLILSRSGAIVLEPRDTDPAPPENVIPFKPAAEAV